MARYKLGDVDKERFYMVPKAFFVDKNYREMSVAAKLTYSFFKDRFVLSRKNGWHDENGDIYLIYPVKKLAEDLNLNSKTIDRVIKELKDNCLIESVRQGAMKPNKIYICKPRNNVTPESGVSCHPKNDPNVTPESGVSCHPKKWGTNDTNIRDTDFSDTEIGIRNSEGVATARTPYQEIVSLYHGICTSLPKVKTLSEARKKAIKARWNEWGKSLDSFRECFTKVETSDFLTGRTKDWTAGFDWIMKPANFTKIMEGTYDNKRHGCNSQPSDVVDSDVDWSKYDG